MSNIRKFPTLDGNRTPADVAEAVKDTNKVFAIAYNEDGELRFHNSTMTNGEALWMLEIAKKMLLEG